MNIDNTLSPGGGFGGGPGKLTTGNLTFGGFYSYYTVQLNGSLPGAGYDQAVVNGAVTLGGSPYLNVSLGFTPSLGQIFVIALNDGADAVSGTFSGLPQNATFNLGPYPFQISYIGKTGNEIILTSLSGDSLNNAPVARPDNYAVAQNTGLAIGAPGVLTNDSDADLDPITVVQAPSTTTKGGTLNVNADGSFTYQPPTGFVGFDEFSYIISDGNDATDLATVTIEVQDVVPPTVTVNNPNGGEVIFVGTQTKLDWTITDKKPVSVSLFISRDLGNTYEKVATDIPNSGSYLWTVTPPGTNTGASPVFSALFRVEARDSSGNVSADVSDSPFALHDLATATLLSLFEVTGSDDGIELRWQLAAPEQFASLAVERSELASGPWLEVSVERRTEDGVTVAIDRTATADQSYVYRLVGTTSDDRRVVLGQLSGERHPTITEFAIGKVAPNPTRDAVQIDYALPRAANVRLSVLDVQGREVALLADRMLGAGRYQATWSGRTERGEAPAGIYFVRCQALGKQLTRRVIRMR